MIAGMRYNGGMTTRDQSRHQDPAYVRHPVFYVIRASAKFSAIAISVIVILATPPLLIIFCFVLALFSAHRALLLSKRARHVKPPPPLLSRFLTPEDRAWLKSKGWIPDR